jgi:hypothetical protein
MSTGAIIGIIIAVIIVAAIVVVASAQLRRTRIRRQFGPEYDRLAQEIGPRKAEAELTARQRRVNALDIRPLSAQQQARYSSDWAVIQEQFVDTPAEAVTAARTLIWEVMGDRGYPVSDTNASVEALSVHHARSFQGYQQTQALPVESATTEQLRGSLIHYRALFEDLTGLQEGPGQPGREQAADSRAAEGSVAADGRVVASDSRIANDGDVAAENTNPTADTPR